MKLVLIIVMLLMLPLSGSLLAGETKEIELTDGSVITGEVLSLNSGVYTIRTGSLGTLKIDDAKVRAIRPQGASSSRPSGPSTEAKSLQEKMMSDQEIMRLIPSLQNDPDFKKIMEDPELMKAVAAGDIAVLMADPRFMKLLSNPTVREIQKKVN